MKLPMHDPAGQVHLQVDDAVACITLSRPGKLNALSAGMRAALGAHLSTVSSDPEVKVVLIHAEGKDFCTGADLADAPGDPLAWRRRVQVAQAQHLQMVRMDKPVIAAVQGRALGGGASLALAADILVMAEDARLVFPFVRLGVVPDGGSSALLQAKAAAGCALDLLLTGGTLDAAEARRVGLTRRVVPPGDLQQASLALARKLAQLPWEALMLTKALCAQHWASRLETVFAHESEAFGLATATQGHEQAMAAARATLARKAGGERAA